MPTTLIASLRRPTTLAIAATLLSLGAASTASAEETLKLDLKNPLNETLFQKGSAAPVQSSPLTAGATYIITVKGTGSIWGKEVYGKSGTCGVAEAAPLEIVPGTKSAPAAWDAATVFASPIGTTIGPVGDACKGLALPITVTPNLYAGFKFAVGKDYDRPTPIGGARTTPRSDHTYSYQVTGQGLPARFGFADAPAADNVGIFTITIRTDAECAAVNCLGKTAASTDQVAAPTVASSGISVTAVGQRSCTVEKVLSVRLVQPKGARFQKAAYYLNGKKLRVVSSKTMYISSKSSKLRVQKFRNLPAGQLKLRVEVTTTKGQRISVRRTIERCSTTKKARAIPVK